MKKELLSFFEKYRGSLNPSILCIDILRMAHVTLLEKEEGYEAYDKKRTLKKIQDPKLNLSWGINSFANINEDDQKKLFNIFISNSKEEIRKICFGIYSSYSGYFNSLSIEATNNLLSKIDDREIINIIMADVIIESYQIINKRKNIKLYFRNQELMALASLLFDDHVICRTYNDLFDMKFEGKTFIHLGPYGLKTDTSKAQSNFSFQVPKTSLIQEIEIMYLLSSISTSRVLGVVSASSTFTQSSQYFREYLLKESHINSIEELPPKTFSGMGIQTFVLDIGGNNPKKKIQIKAKDKELKEITREELAEKEEWNLQRFYSSGFVIMNQTVSLDDVIKDSFRGPPVKRAARGDKLYLVQNKDLKNTDYVNLEELEEDTFETNRNLERYYLQDGDLLIVCRGHSFEVAILKNIKDKKIVCSQNILTLRAGTKIDPYFLYLFFQSPIGQVELKARQVGSAQLILSVKDVQTIKVPMIPFEEQKRISKEFLTAKNKRDQVLKEIEKEFEEDTQKTFKKMGIISEK